MSESKRFLVVADPTAKAQPAVRRALELARMSGADVEVLLCLYNPYISGERFFDSEGLRKSRESYLTHYRDWLEDEISGLDTEGIRVSLDVRWDTPLHEGIVRKALQCNPDLVLKDTHYHPRLERALFSNSDWNLIRACPYSLLLIKPRPTGEIVRILAAVDPTHRHDKPAALDQRILQAATDLGDAVGGEVHVLHSYLPVSALALSAAAIPGAVIYHPDSSDEAVKRSHGAALESLLQANDIPPERVHLVEGRVDEDLRALCEDLDIDVVVMGAVARNALKRTFIGSTAERVMDDLPCDILVVKPAEFKCRVPAS